ncbi:MAG TPA: hypothetical protein VK843_21830 [Planctomycetota bacterium]|nr:hypothetical protein [Planctomycetota bacterium]
MERLLCKTPGCTRTILPSTAEGTGGFCMPCVQASAREARAIFVAANRVEVDRFRGVSGPVEHILLLHDEPPIDPLKVYAPSPRSAGDLYRSLSAEQCRRLVEEARASPELLRTVGVHLAHFSDHSLHEVQRALLDLGEFFPCYVFRGAPLEIVRALIQRLGSKEHEMNQLLVALAWTRHPAAMAAFIRWSADPPPWASSLHVPPAEYTLEAGYEIVDGVPSELFAQDCRAIDFRSAEPRAGESSFVVCEPTFGPGCPSCGDKPCLLVRGLADSSGADVATCLRCVETRVVFAFADFARGWTTFNAASDRQHDARSEPPTREAQLGSPRSSFAAVDWCIGESLSQIGGHPSWFNDANYPTCPSCARRMHFRLQVALEQLAPHSEGIIHAFRCESCAIVATDFEQS